MAYMVMRLLLLSRFDMWMPMKVFEIASPTVRRPPDLWTQFQYRLAFVSYMDKNIRQLLGTYSQCDTNIALKLKEVMMTEMYQILVTLM